MSPQAIIKILKVPLSKTFESKLSLKNINEKGFAKNYGEIFFKLSNLRYFEKLIDEFVDKDGKYKLRCLSTVIKIKKNNVATEFTIVPKTEIVCKLSGKNSICTDKEENACLLKNCSYDKHDAKIIPLSVCPQCIDEMVGEFFIGILGPVLLNEFNKEGIQCTLKRAYRPRTSG